MKKVLFAALLCVAIPVLAGEPIGVVANNNTNSIHLINPLTMELTPSLLKGNLGSYGGGLFDVVITPNGKKAFVSNFGDSRIYCLDIAGGFNAEPSIIGYVDIPFFAEDMDITPDGKWVLVTDGGFSPRCAVVDIETLTLAKNNYLKGNSAQSVSVHPNGQWVYFVDYFGAMIHTYALDAEGVLSYVDTAYLDAYRPVNCAVSPDGKTLIAAISNRYDALAFAINPVGGLYNKTLVTFPAKGGQSVVFSADSTKAYYLSNNWTMGTQVQAMDVGAEGNVTLAASLRLSIGRGTSQLFGVDNMAIDPSGNYLFVTNPTVSGGVVEITVVDLATMTEAAQLKCNGIPTGIAFGTIE